MTKDEILDALEDTREATLEAIEGLTDEVMQESSVIDEWSVKDILFHISMWGAELVKLLWQASQGQESTSLLTSDASVEKVNAGWQAKSHERSLELTLEDFHSVRKQTSRRVEAFSDEDLNNPQRYTWLQGQPLWEWIAGDSYEHEAEHAAQIREWRQRRGL